MVLWLKVSGAKTTIAKYAFSVYANRCLVAILDSQCRIPIVI
jgi:hypothetical protein